MAATSQGGDSDSSDLTVDALRLHAYLAVLRALYAQSEFSWEKEAIVFALRRCLDISLEDDTRAHKTVIGDPTLVKLRRTRIEPKRMDEK